MDSTSKNPIPNDKINSPVKMYTSVIVVSVAITLQLIAFAMVLLFCSAIRAFACADYLYFRYIFNKNMLTCSVWVFMMTGLRM